MYMYTLQTGWCKVIEEKKKKEVSKGCSGNKEYLVIWS